MNLSTQARIPLDNSLVRVYTVEPVIGGEAPAGGADPDKMAG